MVPNDLPSKVALKAIACATQLDCLVVVDVGGKTTTRDMHMFGVNPMWSRKQPIRREAGVMVEGKDMFLGYADQESNSV